MTGTAQWIGPIGPLSICLLPNLFFCIFLMQIHADYVRTLTLYMKDEEKFSVNTYNNRSYCYVVDKYISKSVQKMCGHLGMRQFV